MGVSKSPLRRYYREGSAKSIITERFRDSLAFCNRTGSYDDCPSVFGLDNDSMKKRIDVAVEYSQMAVSIIRKHLPTYRMMSDERHQLKERQKCNLVCDWAGFTSVCGPSYDVIEQNFGFTIAMAIWMLDEIDASGNIKKALALLPRNDESMNYYLSYSCHHPKYDDAVLASMVYVIRNRNRDCTGIQKPVRAPEKFFLTDSYTIRGQNRQNCNSRNTFEALLSLISKESIKRATEKFEKKVWYEVDQYFSVFSVYETREYEIYKTGIALQRQQYEEINEFGKYVGWNPKFEKQAKRMFPAANQTVSILSVPSPSEFAAQSGVTSRQGCEIDPLLDRFLRIEAVSSKPDLYEQKYAELERKGQQATDEFRYFTIDALMSTSLTKAQLEKRYGSEVASIIANDLVDDPYEYCFAFLYLLDRCDSIAWLYYPVARILGLCSAALPWTYSPNERQTFSLYSGSANESSSGISSGDAIDFNWDSFTLEETSPDVKNDDDTPEVYRINYARALCLMTDIVMPRDSQHFNSLALAKAKELGITEKEQLVPFLTTTMLSQAIKNKITFDSTDVAEELKTTQEELEIEKKNNEVLCNDVSSLKKENNRLEKASYDAKKAESRANQTISAMQATIDSQKDEIAELRDLLYSLSQSAEDTTPDISDDLSSGIEFPYHLTKKHIIVGGHPSWLSSMRSMLPDAIFTDSLVASQIKSADVVWIQANSLNHPTYWKAVTIAKGAHVPVRYCTYSSALKCAQLVVAFDKEAPTS